MALAGCETMGSAASPALFVDSQPKTCKSQVNRLPKRGGKRE